MQKDRGKIPRGVMVIVVVNGHGDTSSNPGRDWLHFTCKGLKITQHGMVKRRSYGSMRQSVFVSLRLFLSLLSLSLSLSYTHTWKLCLQETINRRIYFCKKKVTFLHSSWQHNMATCILIFSNFSLSIFILSSARKVASPSKYPFLYCDVWSWSVLD